MEDVHNSGISPSPPKEGSPSTPLLLIRTKKFCTSLGAVVRNWRGQIVAGCSIPKVEAFSPLYAEAQALLEALWWC
ncbi:hypothetical protein F8388_012388 [Cannabis sativa]|uniref:RNase H type-1 domain-containing protein n=1 Tax=Cannabis sativa TaxID=3483 RepID=A0A7J6G378_CANSA|nr:hypothetical protein F8388_012388 [Cannabis sativa]